MCSREDSVGVRFGRLASFAVVFWTGMTGGLCQDLIDRAIGIDPAVQPALEPAGVAVSPQVPLPPGMFQRPQSLPNDEVIPDIEKAWEKYEKECEDIQKEIAKVLDKRVRDAPNVKERKSAEADLEVWIDEKVLPEIGQKETWKKDFKQRSLALESRYRDVEKKALKRRPDLASRLFAERIAVFKPWMKEFRQAGPQGDWLFFSKTNAMPEWRTINPPAAGGAGDAGSGNDSKNEKFKWRLGDEHLKIVWDDGRPDENLELVSLHEGRATAKLGGLIKDGPYWVRLSEVDEWPQTPGIWESPSSKDPNRWLRFVRKPWVFENQNLQASWKWDWEQKPLEKGGQDPTKFVLTVPAKDQVTNRVVVDGRGNTVFINEIYRVEEDDDGVEVCRRVDTPNQGSAYIGGYRPGQKPKNVRAASR